MAKKPQPAQWYDQRPAALLLGLAAFALAYYFGLLALDTAKNVYYLVLFVLIIFGANRIVRAARGR